MPAPKKPRVPRFSPSKINQYRFCPKAYAFQYDQGLRWGGINAAQSLGGSLHRTLQKFHEAGGHAAQDVEAAKAQLATLWSSAGYASEDEAATQRAAAEAMLAQFVARVPEAGRETLGNELTVSQSYGDFVLFGKIDRLDRRADGSLEVIDYKSGRHLWSEDDVRESLAMAVYQLLVARDRPGVAVYTGVLNLRTGDGVFVLRDDAEIAAVEAAVSAEVRAILADAEKAPVPGEQCRACPYPRVCAEGRRWLQTHPAGE